MFLQIFPTLVIPAVIYALIALSSGANVGAVMNGPAIQTGAALSITWGHVLLMFATVMLFIEIVKSTRVSAAQMIDNGLSMMVFVVCFVLFLLVDSFRTGEFLIITLMALLDFMAGTVIATRVSQRTVQYDR